MEILKPLILRIFVSVASGSLSGMGDPSSASPIAPAERFQNLV